MRISEASLLIIVMSKSSSNVNVSDTLLSVGFRYIGFRPRSQRCSLMDTTNDSASTSEALYPLIMVRNVTLTVNVPVRVADGVNIAVALLSSVGVAVGVSDGAATVSVGTTAVSVGPPSVSVGEDVRVEVGVRVNVGVGVGVFVNVAVGVGVSVKVDVGVSVKVAVSLAVVV